MHIVNKEFLYKLDSKFLQSLCAWLTLTESADWVSQDDVFRTFSQSKKTRHIFTVEIEPERCFLSFSIHFPSQVILLRSVRYWSSAKWLYVEAFLPRKPTHQERLTYIWNEQDYMEALNYLRILWIKKPTDPEELTNLAELIDRYESRTWPLKLKKSFEEKAISKIFTAWKIFKNRCFLLRPLLTKACSLNRLIAQNVENKG